MTFSKDGLRELIGHEAIVQTRYRDSKGIWTIGVGHTANAGAPDPKTYRGEMSIPEVVELYLDDLKSYIAAVNKAVKVKVSQTEFDALVSFHFNTGGIAKAALVTSLNAGDRKKAAAEFLNWKKPPEILKRRTKEQTLFATGAYQNGGKANLVPADTTGKVEWSKGKAIDLTKWL
ncbi:lysozyme (plasmid) [Bosea vestrisii]|uniref:lysozyme n=1 Tax=Bosea vestrisii TaxID=151416 RepID=UPI0024E02A6C|nr:lysozyme [Bosea vestrisii]WID99685.1 lysozyme [Bosea vestrisii]